MGRIFFQAGKELDNPPPGSIVDHTVTKRDWYDFFLVSQHVGQGTVSPTHYIVIHDSLDLPGDAVQRLSYKLTHMYYNWPGTVRVPALSVRPQARLLGRGARAQGAQRHARGE